MRDKIASIIKCIICALLVTAITLGAVGCKKSTTKKPSKKPAASSSVSDGTTSDGKDTDSSGDNDTIVDGDDGIDFGNDDLWGDDFEEDWDEESDIEQEIWEDDEFGDIDEEDVLDKYKKYSSPIQCFGAAVEGTRRDITIDNTNVVYHDFLGLGTNSFTAGLSIADKIGYNDVFFEFDLTREKYMKPSVSRLMMQVDWITTDEDPNPMREDIENNKDYKNYLNGIYDFDTAEMKSVYRYLDKYKEIGTEIELDFGWKTNADITNWWSLPVFPPKNSAPMDLEAFANACVATLKNFEAKGYGDMFRYVAFFNEPNNLTGDFMTVGESVPWNIKMIKTIDKALKKAGLRDRIEIWGPEQGQATITYYNYLMQFSADKGIQKCVDNLSFHRYFKSDAVFENNYYSLYNDIVYFNNEFGIRSAVTEMVAAGDVFSNDNPGHVTKYFEDSYSAYIIAAANAGARCALSWCLGGGYCVAPIGMWMGGQTAFITESSVKNTKEVCTTYDEVVLITNYVDAHSDVLMSKWTGDDIKLTSFRSPDGNYTILLETDESDKEYKINIRFKKAINKTFYRMGSDRSETPTIDYTIPSYDKKFDNVTVSIADELPAGPAMYVYTTKEPVKQIKLDQYTAVITKDETAKFVATPIDCSGEIEWSISAVKGKPGTLSHDGVYTPNPNAKKRDAVAIRAALKDNPNIYTTAMVEIKE